MVLSGVGQEWSSLHLQPAEQSGQQPAVPCAEVPGQQGSSHDMICVCLPQNQPLCPSCPPAAGVPRAVARAGGAACGLPLVLLLVCAPPALAAGGSPACFDLLKLA